MAPIPQSRELVFKENPARPDIYDLTGSRFKGFTFIRLSQPRSEFLIRQGAKWVIESWDHGQKPLFSGLRLIREGLYYGDYFHNCKRALMIVRMNPGELIVHLFKSYPRGKRLQRILMNFPATKNPGNHPRVNLSPTEPATGPISNTKVQI